jgi:hypothetical protein
MVQEFGAGHADSGSNESGSAPRIKLSSSRIDCSSGNRIKNVSGLGLVDVLFPVHIGLRSGRMSEAMTGKTGIGQKGQKKQEHQ